MSCYDSTICKNETRRAFHVHDTFSLLKQIGIGEGDSGGIGHRIAPEFCWDQDCSTTDLMASGPF